MKIGYARISGNDHNIAMQVDALKQFGCKKIYKDTRGSFENRPELELMISHLKKNDVVIVWKLDRIAKSLYDLKNLITNFKDKGIHLVSIRENVDIDKKESIRFYEIIETIAEFEREINSERINSGLETARKRGRKGGRPGGLSVEAVSKAKAAKKLYEDDNITVEDIARRLNIGKTTLYRYLHYSDEKLIATRDFRNQTSNQEVYEEKLKDELIEKLISSKAFWSYSNVIKEEISDDLLIHKVMEDLDLPDIMKLFKLFKKNYIRNIWKKELVLQDPYFRSLNLMIAKLFFNIRKPESYIEHVRREYLGKI